jgi:vacuolar-type H+-ATPase subunit H
MKNTKALFKITCFILCLGFATSSLHAEKTAGQKLDKAIENGKDKYNDTKEKAHEKFDEAKEEYHYNKEKAQDKFDESKEKVRDRLKV